MKIAVLNLALCLLLLPRSEAGVLTRVYSEAGENTTVKSIAIVLNPHWESGEESDGETTSAAAGATAAGAITTTTTTTTTTVPPLGMKLF